MVAILNSWLWLFVLIPLWWFFFWPYRQYRIDLYRQRVFAIRDGLFMDAVNGNIRFDEPAYRNTRMSLNGAIRFADQMSFFEYFAFMAIVRISDEEVAEVKREVTETLDKASSDSARNSMIRARYLVHLLTLDHAIHTSLFAPILIPIRFVFLQLLRAGIAKKDRSKSVARNSFVKRVITQFDKDIHDCGSQQPG